ncbi:MAG: hypothetical protein HDS78_03180 [Bacteroidales bacterium]|nr:hypothetical protein [Bacteroidales bacterium]
MANIKYNLRGVSVEQFATLFEPTSDRVNLNVEIPIKTNYADRAFAVGANIQFLEDDKPFLVAEAMCHYQIEEKCWLELSNDGTTDVVIPAQLMDTLTRIAIGTVRGAICVKTENTPFAKYFMPIIEIGAPGKGFDFILTRD